MDRIGLCFRYQPESTLSAEEVKGQLKLLWTENISRGCNLLHVACAGGDLEFPRFALGMGIDINSLDGKQRNALHYALDLYDYNSCKPFQLVEHLIQSGIDYEKRDKDGRKPIDMTQDQDLKQKVIGCIDEINLR